MNIITGGLKQREVIDNNKKIETDKQTKKGHTKIIAMTLTNKERKTDIQEKERIKESLLDSISIILYSKKTTFKGKCTKTKTKLYVKL